MSDSPLFIRVAAAILEQNGCVLLARRAEAKDPLAGRWEFPGGKLEPGETPEACLQRELTEELGIETQIDKFFAESSYPETSIQLLAYRVRWTGGALCPKVHDKLAWVADDILHYDLLPADIPLAECWLNECVPAGVSKKSS